MTQSTEHAIVYDNGIQNGYRINFDLIGTKAYHDRFENLTKHKAVNESLYKQALAILGRRSGTEYEELIVIDSRTGALLAENAERVGLQPSSSGLNQKQKEALEARGKNFEALHNHPSNSIPSPEDIIALFSRKLQVGSTIVFHNGAVYRLGKIKPFDGIKDLIAAVHREVYYEHIGYTDDLIKTKTSLKVIGILQRKGILDFKAVL